MNIWNVWKNNNKKEILSRWAVKQIYRQKWRRAVLFSTPPTRPNKFDSFKNLHYWLQTTNVTCDNLFDRVPQVAFIWSETWERALTDLHVDWLIEQLLIFNWKIMQIMFEIEFETWSLNSLWVVVRRVGSIRDFRWSCAALLWPYWGYLLYHFRWFKVRFKTRFKTMFGHRINTRHW